MAEAESNPHILGVQVHSLDYCQAAGQIADWAARHESRMVCLANVHMVMEAWDDHEFRRQLNTADLVLLDGMPLVWALKSLGIASASRVRGQSLTLKLCEIAAAQGVSIGLYGGQDDATLDRAVTFLQKRWPDLQVSAAISPPFRALSVEEDARVTNTISAAGVQILFVGIGCPKQERWMHQHRGQLNCVMLGVGAAFDMFAGRIREAPEWMQKSGLEWLFRLLSEPGRLWKRYFKQNPRFMLHFSLQRLGLGKENDDS